MKKEFVRIFTFALLLLLTLSCSSLSDAMEGEFSTRKNGASEIKITKKDGNYFIFMKSGALWGQPEQLQELTKKDLKEMFGQECDKTVLSGIGGGEGFMILHVQRGASCGGWTFKSDYLMKTPMRGIFLYKIK